MAGYGTAKRAKAKAQSRPSASRPNGSTPTTIWDSSGKTNGGYISNGLTYYDNGQRISEGATVVDSSGREWTMQNGKGVATGNRFGVNTGNNPSNAQYGEEQYNPYADYMSEVEKRNADIQRQQEEARRAAIEQSVGKLESNRGTVNQRFDDTARQAYIQKMQAQQNLPQMLVGQGITGGGSETAQIALDTSYGNNIADNERGRQNAMNDLDSAISDVRTTGDISIADSRLALQQQGLSDYQNAYMQKIQQDNHLKEFAQNGQANGMQAYQNTIGAYGADYAAEINRLLASGVPKDDYRVKMLYAARNQKLAEQAAGASEQQQQDFDNEIAWGKYNYQVNKPYYSPRSKSSSTEDLIKSMIGR